MLRVARKILWPIRRISSHTCDGGRLCSATTKITHSLIRALSPPPLRRATATATTMTIDRTICGGGGGGNVSLDGTRGAVIGA